MGATWHARPRGAYAAGCDMCIFIYRKYNVYSTYKHPIVQIQANLQVRHIF